MANAPGATSGTTINRVRLLGDGGDALAARLSVERILGRAANVSSLPPSAILCVKRVRDPLPGSIRLTTSAAVTARWTQSLHETLAEMARRAVRPARGGAAADADAVLFDDRAQLLACLADDWCSGQIGARWWWRALCGRSLDVRALLRMFLERPEHIAAAIDELAHVDAAIPFVRRLTSGDTRMLLDAVVATHNLHEIAQAIAASIDLPDAPGNGPLSTETSTMSARAEYMALDNRRAAPWQHVAPEASKAELHPNQQLLIGVALTVRRRPILARSAHFAAAMREWRVASVQTLRVASDQTPRHVISAATPAVVRQLVEHSSEPGVDAAPVGAESAPVAMAVDPQPSEETPAVDARVERALMVSHHATQQLAITEREAVTNHRSAYRSWRAVLSSERRHRTRLLRRLHRASPSQPRRLHLGFCRRRWPLAVATAS